MQQARAQQQAALEGRSRSRVPTVNCVVLIFSAANKKFAATEHPLSLAHPGRE